MNLKVAEALNRASLRKVQEARAVVTQLSATVARSAGWEDQVAALTQERDDVCQERDAKSNRVQSLEMKAVTMSAKCRSLPLARELLNIALVDASDLTHKYNWNSDPTQDLSFSVMPSNIGIGVWKHVEQSRTSPIESMQVWDGISNSRIFFPIRISTPVGSTFEMARLTENLNLHRALLCRLDEIPERVELIDQVKVKSITRSRTWPIVNLSGGRSLRTRLLIGADGFKSSVQSFAEIGSSGWAYPSHAVVGTLHHPSSNHPQHNTTAYQRFLPTGPIAFLPLTKEVSTVVWSTSVQLASILCSVHPDVGVYSLLVLHTLGMRADGITPESISEEIKFRENAHGIGVHSALYPSDVVSSGVGIPPMGSGAYPPLVHSVQAGSQASFPLKLSHADSFLHFISPVSHHMPKGSSGLTAAMHRVDIADDREPSGNPRNDSLHFPKLTCEMEDGDLMFDQRT
ncbi:hypothetical protein BS47DRAFT_1386322 [Hydnum rufescens UP504]|uniref:FAD-binding domain-containing protein n=1 Tax=Hydnum rufescens UP504 TaxID=1448309 RepID=A0A9P6AEA7_9AGAM|nr:hypothetical protein BS47DRAFT_1386322 [Hydnum rufescens UP504]